MTHRLHPHKPTHTALQSPSPQRGFTLIELMITVAIIGALAAIAIPSYNEYLAKGRRSGAQTQLLLAQQWMERLYSESYDYTKDSSGTLTNSTNGFAKQPFAKSPTAGSGTTAYTLTLSALTASSYTITATRTGPASSDKCGNFSLTNTGVKSVTLLSVAECWR